MDQDLYDEFGNYIGPEDASEEEGEREGDEREGNRDEADMLPAGVKVINAGNEHRIVLHEDKKYYQAHQEMYPEAEIMIEQEDRQNLDTPLIPKQDQKHYDYEEVLETYYDTSYMEELMKNPALVRNVCVAGHLHHGKTLLMDILIQETHLRKPEWNMEKNYRWLDTRVDQQQRQLSIKAMPITLLLEGDHSKSYIFNFIDTPGHPNFIGELAAGIRLCDGVMLVIDAVEGVMLMTQKIIKYIIRERLSVVVVINKIDRLILELKIPPEDAYLKLKYILQQINGLFVKYSAQLGMGNNYVISPTAGNVVFASAEYSFMFTLESMGRKYAEKYPKVDWKTFGSVLWGDYYYDKSHRKFTRNPPAGHHTSRRTFVEFILEPLYKIFAHTVGKDRGSLEEFLFHNLSITLTPAQYKLNIKTMIKLIMHMYLGSSKCLVSALVSHIDTAPRRTAHLISTLYRGEETEFKQGVRKGSNHGPLLINAVKMYHQKDYKGFYVLGRVLSGVIKTNDKLRIMGENYQPGDEEDLSVKNAKKLYLLQGRYRIEVGEVSAGNLVLIEGIDQGMTKTATITHAQPPSQVDIMAPLKYWTQPTIKVAIQPLLPSQLPKMIQAIRRANKSYLLLKTKVEESGEHILIGTGQMHLDCILHDIRTLYSDIQVRISDPCVTFAQTVIQTSGIPCYADTPNKKNRLKALAGPLQKGIAQHIEKELVNVTNQSQVKSFLQKKYDWDILASSNVWSFGPQVYGSNVFINDTLPSGTDQIGLTCIKKSVIQGFKWSTREGPLCDEPMRNVKFRLIDAEISKNPGDYPPGQMVPTARRCFYSAFLTANPRLMEPVYYTEIQCTSSESIEAVFTVLAKRRGAVQNDIPRPGTPHYIIKALIPCIEAIGFQTDLRVHTIGQAFCLSTFDHWQTLPGDPLDKNIILRPLQVHQHHQLARQFMIKTRRRKGLNEEVSIVKYFDDLNIKELLKNDATFKDFM